MAAPAPVASVSRSAHQLPKHAVALAALVDIALAALASKPPPEGRNSGVSHIIGRPNDDLLDVRSRQVSQTRFRD